MVRIVIFIELVELDDLAQVVLRLRLLRLMRIKNCWEKFRLGKTNSRILLTIDSMLEFLKCRTTLRRVRICVLSWGVWLCIALIMISLVVRAN